MKMSKEHKVYLDELRESGITNMYGAPECLKNHFIITMREAREIFLEWVDTFKRKE